MTIEKSKEIEDILNADDNFITLEYIEKAFNNNILGIIVKNNYQTYIYRCEIGDNKVFTNDIEDIDILDDKAQELINECVNTLKDNKINKEELFLNKISYAIKINSSNKEIVNDLDSSFKLAKIIVDYIERAQKEHINKNVFKIYLYLRGINEIRYKNILECEKDKIKLNKPNIIYISYNGAGGSSNLCIKEGYVVYKTEWVSPYDMGFYFKPNEVGLTKITKETHLNEYTIKLINEYINKNIKGKTFDTPMIFDMSCVLKIDLPDCQMKIKNHMELIKDLENTIKSDIGLF